MALVVCDQAFAYGRIGRQLQIARYSGGYIKAFGVGLAAVAPDHLGSRHFGYVRRYQFGCWHVVTDIDRLGERLFVALLVNATQAEHAPENPVAALNGACRVD